MHVQVGAYRGDSIVMQMSLKEEARVAFLACSTADLRPKYRL
ncbi:MAG: hypothetical protein ABSD49_08615 [Candidatus Bathyarchaeia archaeon]